MAATPHGVDLTNVKERGNFRPKRRPEGDYRSKIVKADDHQKEGKAPGWVLTIQVEGDARSSYPYYLSTDTKQAWKIGAICRATGLRVPTKRVRFDPNKLVNKALGIALADDEFEGKIKSAIDDVFPVSEVSPNADDGAPDDDEYEDEVEVPDDEEPEEESEEEEEEEEEEPTPPPRKRAARRKPAPEPEPEDDEEEEDEEEPPPPPRKRAVRPTAKKAPAKKPVDEDDDLDEIELDDLDD